MKILFILTFFGLMSGLALAQGTPAEQRLREQLKAVMGQLKTAEADKATLQADKTALDEKVAAREKALAEITKQANTDKETAAKDREALKAEIAASKVETAKYMDLHVKADAEGKKAAELARKTKGELDKAVAEGIRLKDIVAGQRTRNQKMHELSMEILDRYAKFGLGTALTAREPFVGVTRARLETMVEESRCDIDAQRIRIGGGTVPGSPAPAAGAKDRPADGKPGEKKSATKP